MYHQKYIKYKIKYLSLKNNFVQTAGGTWSTFSHQNDYTQDLLSDLDFKDLNNTKNGLTKLLQYKF